MRRSSPRTPGVRVLVGARSTTRLIWGVIPDSAGSAQVEPPDPNVRVTLLRVDRAGASTWLFSAAAPVEAHLSSARACYPGGSTRQPHGGREFQ